MVGVDGRKFLVFAAFWTFASSIPVTLTRSEELWFEKIYKLMSDPVTLLNSYHGNNSLCERHLQFYLREWSNFSSWALQMYDSSTKLPEGVLSGNLVQLGDFDQCLDVVAPNGSFTGKHCIATFISHINTIDPSIKNPQQLRYKNLQWSNCIPSSCSSSDWETRLNETFKLKNITFNASVDALDCHVQHPNYLSTADEFVVAFFVFFGVLVILSTVYDLLVKEHAEKMDETVTQSVVPSTDELRPSATPFTDEPRPSATPFTDKPGPSATPFTDEPGPSITPFTDEPGIPEVTSLDEPGQSKTSSTTESEPHSDSHEPPAVSTEPEKLNIPSTDESSQSTRTSSPDEPGAIHMTPSTNVRRVRVREDPQREPRAKFACFKERREIFVIFSLRYNARKLFSTTASSEDNLPALNAIRFLSMVWIIAGHVYLVYASAYPVFNIAFLEHMLNSQTRSFGHLLIPFIYNSSVAVDTFFLLSGLLISYTYFRKSFPLTRLTVLKFYLYRYIRLTPAFLAIILLQATIFDKLGSGPIWDKAFQNFVNPCKTFWWSSLLYVQNYVNPDKMCVGHSWYLAIDMQLYILSPFLLKFLIWKKRVAVYVLGGLVAVGVLLNFATAFIFQLSPSIFVRPDIYFPAMGWIYLPTHVRYPSWLIGIILGYLLFKVKQRNQDFVLSKNAVRIYWTLAVLVCLLTVWIIFPMIQLDYVYNPIACITYLMLYRTLWTLGVSWIIFACVTGYGGPVNTLLSWQMWQPLGRLTYSLYLIHVPLLFMRSFSSKIPVYASGMNMVSDIIGNFGVTLLCAILLSLVFESPALSINKLFVKKVQPQTTHAPLSSEEPQP